MYDITIIKEIVLILLVAIPIQWVFKNLRLPGIIGFLIAGVVIGPSALELIEESERLNLMADIGVIMLMFTIGLEFSIEKLIKLKKILLTVGSLQIVLTLLISSLIFYLLKFSINQALFFGMLVSLSSTAIVMKIFVDKNELDAPHGKLALAISIMQDLSIVPMLILLPSMAASGKADYMHILLKTLYAFGAITVIIFLARFLIPKIFYYIASIRLREVFTITILLLILGTAYITQSIGMTLSIGAFIAGLIISDSEYSYQIVSEILPFKDAFNSIFFISVGLLLNLGFVYENWLIIILLVAGIILLKSLVVITIVLLLKYSLRTALLTGLSLAQIGEFSFVLAQSGLRVDLISGIFYNAFIASTIFTMLLTPFLIKAAPYLEKLLTAAGLKKEEGGKEILHANIRDHVIIAGYGLNGRNLSRVLRETGISYLIIDLNPDTVIRTKAEGENIMYGDITRKEILTGANITEANIIVFAISDPEATKIGLQLAKSMNRSVYCIVRTRYASETDGLLKLGADEVIPEEFETSLQIFSKVLRKYHIPLNVIMQQINLLRSESYGFMRLSEYSAISPFVNIDEILAAGLIETFFVGNNNKYRDKSVREINLRAVTGATIIAIIRNNNTLVNISPDEVIRDNDTLIITGNHKAVDDAIDYLNGLGTEINE